MKRSTGALAGVLVLFSVLLEGCGGGGGSGTGMGHTSPVGPGGSGAGPAPTSTFSNLQSTAPGGFPGEATGLFQGDMVADSGGLGSISFLVNSSGIVESGEFRTGDGLRATWTPSAPWPAGNPGVAVDRFLTSDSLEGGSEAFQGSFNGVTGEWSGRWDRSANYPGSVIGGSGATFTARKVAGALRAAPASALTMQGQLFAGPKQDSPFVMGVKVYDDGSAVVTGTTTDGRSIMIVGKQVVSPLSRSVVRDAR